MKLVIGLLGEKGSGKATFTKLFKELIGDSYTIDRVGSGDLLGEIIDILYPLPKTRLNLQTLPIAINYFYGIETTTKALRSRIESCKGDIVVLDALRLPPDLDMLRSLPNNKLLYITANFEKRLANVRGRPEEKVGESTITREQFMAEEDAETEVTISHMALEADFTIDNNGSLDDLRMQIIEFANSIIMRVAWNKLAEHP